MKKDSEQIAESLIKFSDALERASTTGDLKSAKAQLDLSPLLQTVYLGRIAYQLAKLNEHFEMVDAAVFGGKIEKKKEIPETEHRP